MTRSAGIDLDDSYARVAVLSASYRKLELETLVEEPIASHESPEAALKVCFDQLGEAGFDAITVTLPGNRTFAHRLALPKSAEKRLTELLPFELEGELPIEVDEVVFDHHVTRPSKSADEDFEVLVLAARTQHVSTLIETIDSAIGQPPERVGASSFELGQLVRLAPELVTDHPLALVSLGYERSDVCVLVDGKVQYGRSLSLGIGGFPDRADALVAQLRQSLSAFAASTGQRVGRLVVVGDGARVSGIGPYLAGRLDLEVGDLPNLTLEGGAEFGAERRAVFARALGSAIHGIRGGGYDLRKGELAFERGYGFIKERAPLLAGLLGAILVSFLFATWAEGSALDREHEALVASLEQITRDTFDSATPDPHEAENLLAKARKNKPEDPMPYMDGFGAAVAFAEIMPEGIQHDIEDFDIAKGKVKLRGIVDETDEAQKIAKAFGEHRCIEDQKITKISQVVNSDRERYVLEATIRCPEDAGADSKSKKKKSGGSK